MYIHHHRFLNSRSLTALLQSGFCLFHHSTDVALAKVTDDFLVAKSIAHCLGLILSDLPVAFGSADFVLIKNSHSLALVTVSRFYSHFLRVPSWTAYSTHILAIP